jgi:predicted amidophosphoribosyltransferase
MSNVITLKGNWTAGWALDLHTSSAFRDDEGVFWCERTAIGEALYRLKYALDEEQIPFLAKEAVLFLRNMNLLHFSAIIPVPPSDLSREFQPVEVLADAIGKIIDIRVDKEYLQKIRNTSVLKDIFERNERIKQLQGAFEIKDMRYRNKELLIFDDLFRSGATLNEICKVIKGEGKARNIYILTMTKTRTKR